jgi:hypothetical protein
MKVLVQTLKVDEALGVFMNLSIHSKTILAAYALMIAKEMRCTIKR